MDAKIIKTCEERCTGCNQCAIVCPARANTSIFKFEKNIVCVRNDLCIQCGECLDLCEQGSRAYSDDTQRFFIDLQRGLPISVIAVPSIVHYFSEYEKLLGYLKAMGVNLIYDVSMGADLSAWGLIKAIREFGLQSVIAPSCPVVVHYIEKYKPELIPCLAPVQSPPVCAAIYLRKYENCTDQIAFLSPCIARSYEIDDPNTGNFIHYNVTIEKLMAYIKDQGVDLSSYKTSSFDNPKSLLSRNFPRPGWLGETMKLFFEKSWIHSVEGINPLLSYLNTFAADLKAGEPLPLVLDALSCQYGCNLGTGTGKTISVNKINYYANQQENSPITKVEAEEYLALIERQLDFVDFKRTYTDKSNAWSREKESCSKFTQSLVKNTVDQYETLVSAVPGGILVVEANEGLEICYANQGYYELVGYTKEEHLQLFHDQCSQIFQPDEADKLINSASEQIRATGAFNIKAKLSHKTKGYIWAHFSGRLCKLEDYSIIYIVIVDINEHIELIEKLEKEREFNHLIEQLTDDAFFDCDIKAEIIRYSKNFADRFGIPEIIYNYPQSILEKDIVAEDSLHLFENRFNKNTSDVIEEEIHLKLPQDGDAWYLYHYNIIRDHKGKPIRAVGKMTDITKQRTIIEELSEKAERDQLTGLYNKTTTEYLIKETLKKRRFNDDKHALLIIDVDNFKTINDTLGHLYGDIVITQLADFLKPLFRTDDVIGRVGGDEFFVFLKNFKSLEMLKIKAKEICRLFRKTYTENEASVNISASIGIAIYPDHGTEFDTLYRSADTALYNTKANNKNNFTIFDGNTVNTYQSTRTAIDSHGGIQKNFRNNRIEYIFKLLYGSENQVSSVKSVLQLLTEHFGFSRGYIFENSDDDQYTSNTFEWSAEGIEPEIRNLQNIPIQLISTASKSFYQTGMFILKNLSELPRDEQLLLETQNIKSMFQFGIIHEGRLIGFIGFDDCVKEHIPTDAEIDEICTICHLLATFLVKQRGAELEKQHRKALETVMDNLDCITYVIDQEDFTILYENKHAISLTGSPSVGSKCHLAYWGNTQPCADCPMFSLSDQKLSYSSKICNKKFNLPFRFSATEISWVKRKKAYLIHSTIHPKKGKENKGESKSS